MNVLSVFTAIIILADCLAIWWNSDFISMYKKSKEKYRLQPHYTIRFFLYLNLIMLILWILSIEFMNTPQV